MKSSSLPALRVSPELRAEAESVLAPGESLSSFVHEAVVRSIELRKSQQEFLERGLLSAASAQESGRYVSSGAALKTLGQQIETARSRRRA